jgi:putative nucleotidyltransferase with HDIG domain
VGSVWWARRPGSRDIVFADLMLWGWLRRVRTERRLASARGLLGRSAYLDPARKAALLERMSSALESRDLYTHGHSRRVTRHSYRIARQLGLPAADAARIRTAAALHDVGKVETPREVLNKPGRLSDEEFATIKRHPVDGACMVEALGDDELTSMVRHHHERLDGTGYPDGLAGNEIPLGARIIAVADTFDAMTSSRPYRGACKHKKALDVLTQEAGSQLDPGAVAAFRRYYSGKRSVAWSAFLVTAPQRLGTWAGGLFQGASVGAAPLGQGVLAMGAAALSGAALGGQAASATGGVEGAANRDGAGQVAIHRARAGRDLMRSDGNRPRSRSRPQRHNGSNRPPAQRGSGQRAGSHALGGGGDNVALPPPEGPAPVPGPIGDGPGAVPVGRGSHPESPTPQPPTAHPPKPKPPKPEAPKPERPKPESPKPKPPKPPKPPRPEPPSVQVPPVEVPPVEVPPVQVPPVQVPPVQVPPVEVPDVNVPTPVVQTP